MKKKVLGIILGIIGIVVLLNSYSGITGFVTFEDVGKQIGNIFGIAFVIGGVLLMASRKERKRERLEEKLEEETNTKKKIKLVEQAYHQHVLDETETADQLNDITRLKGMDYRTQTKFTVESEDGVRYPLQSSKKDTDLAYAVRARVLANDPKYGKNIQMHISKEESTKHHKKGLRK